MTRVCSRMIDDDLNVCTATAEETRAFIDCNKYTPQYLCFAIGKKDNLLSKKFEKGA